MSVSDSALTPLRFLQRSASVWADRPAVSDGDTEHSYAELYDRVSRGVGMLKDELGISPGARVAVLAPNVGPVLELHYSVPGARGVLVPLNTRLASEDYAHILRHSGAQVLIAHAPLRGVLEPALDALGAEAPRVLWTGELGGVDQYEQLLAAATPRPLELVADENALLSINYTSGTTGRPKGVMTSHRGAYLHSLGVIAETGLNPRSAYLWTLPMFHCNGWACTWAVTAMGAHHVCLARVHADMIWQAIGSQRITHMCAAPTVVSMMLDSPAARRCQEPLSLFVGGAPPSPALLERAAEFNMAVTHLYGLTETYGPLAVCAWNPDWDELTTSQQMRLRARQGVSTIVSESLRVVDEQMRDVPSDGEMIGEIVMRGNNVMLGYYRDPEATEAAFRGGWFHSGDLGVMHSDGYVEIRDRLKDIVISGGENVSTIEVEQALHSHPSVREAAVVGMADERWGEVPVAFVVLVATAVPDDEALGAHLRERLASFKVPRRFVFVSELPKSGTGKIQKFELRRLINE